MKRGRLNSVRQIIYHQIQSIIYNTFIWLSETYL